MEATEEAIPALLHIIAQIRDQMAHERILIAKHLAGSIIGKKGVNIKRLKTETGADIDIPLRV